MGTSAHDTWGITPAAFLTIYGVAFLATLVWSELRRHRILRNATPDPVPDIRDLDPCDVALLTHGPDEARAVALLDLERIGVVQIDNAAANSIARAVPDDDGAASRS